MTTKKINRLIPVVAGKRGPRGGIDKSDPTLTINNWPRKSWSTIIAYQKKKILKDARKLIIFLLIITVQVSIQRWRWDMSSSLHNPLFHNHIIYSINFVWFYLEQAMGIRPVCDIALQNFY